MRLISLSEEQLTNSSKQNNDLEKVKVMELKETVCMLLNLNFNLSILSTIETIDTCRFTITAS